MLGVTALATGIHGRWRSGGLWVTFIGVITIFQVQAFSVGPRFMIDSHLHVWGDGKGSFPYAEGQEPPERLRASSSPEVLIQEMDEAGVGGALIVQPINYKFDHSYVLDAVSKWPGKFKGMCLANPSLSPQDACAELERLHDQGFCSVRFNPYLWPEGGEGMKDDTGVALYGKAGELGMPVGVMCFKGFGRHVKEIEALLLSSPQTKLVVDHFGFFLQDGENDEAAWEQLLALAKYPQVFVKTSALFRVAKDAYPYQSLQPRFAALIKHFGSKRLLWGSDFPFVSDGQCGYGPAKDVVCGSMSLTDEEVHNITGGTAQALFGSWADGR
ncbi:unnamed protein product [Pylaiella littoralis]